ncbi:hypothetical protein EGR_10682 [Echinococcus granulosus]|uniref:Uncharacterized protein n=1 Tax=Echinococcus granulosus TaxID=6210 RepID=W6U064_ECHGR|nr:hypothetical protein EGR_10682 [Echinococcus granulosus]EUB54460.1 hypothetical protein EGR_10682 [Echinococcus granulosus]
MWVGGKQLKLLSKKIFSRNKLCPVNDIRRKWIVGCIYYKRKAKSTQTVSLGQTVSHFGLHASFSQSLVRLARFSSVQTSQLFYDSLLNGMFLFTLIDSEEISERSQQQGHHRNITLPRERQHYFTSAMASLDSVEIRETLILGNLITNGQAFMHSRLSRNSSSDVASFDHGQPALSSPQLVSLSFAFPLF